jgi:hypothetical protein
MASQHQDALRLPVTLLVLSLLAAGCGGDHSRAAGGADTTAVARPDSTAMPVVDSAAQRDSATASAADTAAKPSATAPAPAPKTASSDTGAKQHTAAAPESKKAATKQARTAHATAGAPSAQAKVDTTRVAKAESTNSAATPAPAPTPEQQDTSKATAGNADAPLRDAYHQAPKDTVSQAVYEGWKQFNLNCARCHGEDALGTTIAPHLIVSLKPDGPINTKELFMQTVCAGRPTKGMPSWCALGLGMDKIDEIYQYVKGRSDAKISPGRPAVKPQG